MVHSLHSDDRFLRDTFNRFLVPTMLSVLGGTINVFFDSILVGQRMGYSGLAAISLCMPLSLLMYTLGALIGTGSAIAAARRIGAGQDDASQRIYNTANLSLLLLGLLLTFIGVFFIDVIVDLICKSPDLYDMVRQYSLILFYGCGFKLLLYIPFNFLRLDGRNKGVAFIMLLMTGMNIVLDWVFLFVLDMGIGGAAWASVIATFAAFAIGYMLLFDKRSTFHLTAKLCTVRDFVTGLRLGSPAALNNLVSCLRVLALNFLLLHFGGTEYVAVFAVVNSISEFSLCIITGIPQTANQINGVFSAERNNNGIRILFHRQLKAGLFMCIVFGASIVLLAKPIGLAFGIDIPLYIPLLCFGLSLPVAMLNSIFTEYYNSSGRTQLSVAIIVGRLALFSIIFAALFLNFSICVWLFYPLAEALTLAFCLFYILTRSDYSHLAAADRLLLLDNTLEEKGYVVDFSITSSNADICQASEKITDFCVENQLSQKEAMRVSLAIEEILTVLAEKCYGSLEYKPIDIRAFALDGSYGIRVRCGGEPYNIFDPENIKEDPGSFMGITMIMKMAKRTMYQLTFGVNSMMVLF